MTLSNMTTWLMLFSTKLARFSGYTSWNSTAKMGGGLVMVENIYYVNGAQIREESRTTAQVFSDRIIGYFDTREAAWSNERELRAAQ